MTIQQPLVRAARCPNCGAPVETTRPGDAMACSFCGSRLERGAGAAAGSISGGDDNELATVYLARAQHLPRVREQLGEVEERLVALRDKHDATSQQIKLATAGIENRTFLWLGGGGLALCLFFAATLVAEGGPGCFLVLLLASFGLLGIELLGNSNLKRRRAALESALAEIVAEGTTARAERDRLGERVAELEAGLDELGERL